MSTRGISATIDDIYSLFAAITKAETAPFTLFWLTTRVAKKIFCCGFRTPSANIFGCKFLMWRLERCSESDFSECRCSTLHCSSDPQFLEIRSDERLQGVLQQFEEKLLDTEQKSRSGWIWAFLPSLKKISALAEKFCKRRTTFRLSFGGYVHDKRDWGCSGFRKVTKRRAFYNDDSVFKILYLRWILSQVEWKYWALVRNQLDERMSAFFDKFDF